MKPEYPVIKNSAMPHQYKCATVDLQFFIEKRIRTVDPCHIEI